MMKTSYGFGANLWRFQGIYSAFWVILIFLLFLPFEPELNESKNGFIMFVFFVMLWGWINLWLQPIVQIEKDGIFIVRLLGMAKRKVKWNNIRIFKKVRTFTRFGLIGTDPRYAVIKIKDGIFLDRRAAILSFFKEYDEFIEAIEKHLSPEDIITDKNYT